MSLERVQKIMAQAGITSRRKAETLIEEGSVTINGRVAKLGDKAEWGKDAIKVGGKLLRHSEPPVYLIFNKPKGVISTFSDPDGRPTLATFLEKLKVRVFPVGQLDFNSQGLLLLTNDGATVEKIQKMEKLLRVYRIKVKGHPTAEMLARLEKGARLDPAKRVFRPNSVRLLKELQNKSMIELSVLGGGSIDLKAFFEMKGFLVESITRTQMGHLSVEGILPGQFRFLKATQVEALIHQPKLGHGKTDIPRPKPTSLRK